MFVLVVKSTKWFGWKEEGVCGVCVCGGGGGAVKRKEESTAWFYVSFC